MLDQDTLRFLQKSSLGILLHRRRLTTSNIRLPFYKFLENSKDDLRKLIDYGIVQKCMSKLMIYNKAELNMITKKQKLFMLRCLRFLFYEGTKLGLPYFEKQKSGHWMTDFHETRFMAPPTFFSSKAGR